MLILHFFTKLYPLNNYEKCFVFYLKCSFCFRDIQIFVFSSSPLFFLVDQKSCQKRASKASSRPLFILVNNPEDLLHARNLFENKIFKNNEYQKALKKLTPYFL